MATKFGLEGLTQSLGSELAPFGIKISIIEPRAIKTRVASHSMYIPKKLAIHRDQQHFQLERSNN